jgi:hypothetical protein
VLHARAAQVLLHEHRQAPHGSQEQGAILRLHRDVRPARAVRRQGARRNPKGMIG